MVNEIERADRLIDYYARDLEGLTAGECEDEGFNAEQCVVLTRALGKGREGEITASEVKDLRTSGFSNDFIGELRGSDGLKALQSRAKWLGENIVTRWWRCDYNDSERADMVIELGQIGRIAATAVYGLIETLTDDDPYVREKTAETLGKIDTSAATAGSSLIAALDDGNSNVREEAAEALGNISISPETASDDLLTALYDRDPDVREEAAKALAKIGVPKSLIPRLAEALKAADLDVNLRVILTGAFVKTGEDAIPALIEALKDDSLDKNVQQAVIDAFGKIGKTAVPYLTKALDDSSPNARKRLFEALVKIGEPAVSALIEIWRYRDGDLHAPALDALVKIRAKAAPQLFEVFRNCDQNMRGEVIEALVKIGIPALPALVEASTSACEAVKNGAAEVAGRMGILAATVLPKLIESFMSKGQGFLSPKFIRALGNIGTPEAIQVLTELVYSNTPSECCQAMLLLGALGESAIGAVPALVKKLGDPDYILRALAVSALVGIGEDAIPALQNVLQYGNNFSLLSKKGVISTLAKIGSQRAIYVLRDASKRGDEHVRTAAVEALGTIGTPEVIPILIEALSDRDSGVQDAAVCALIKIKGPAVDPLIEAVKNSNTFALAVKALAGIGEIAIDALIAKLGTNDPNIGNALVEIGEPAKKKLIDKMNDKDADPKIRASAANLIGRIAATPPAEPADVLALIGALTDSDTGVSRQAFNSLVAMSERAIPALIKALDDKNLEAKVTEVLVKINTPAFIRLVPLLRLDNPPMFEKAARILAQIAPNVTPAVAESAVPRLINALTYDDIPASMRETAVETLSVIAAPAVPALIEGLQTRNTVARGWLAEALGKIGTPAVLALIEALNGDVFTRSGAALALGRIGQAALLGLKPVESEVIKALQNMATNDPDEFCREEAKTAINRITGSSVKE